MIEDDHGFSSGEDKIREAFKDAETFPAPDDQMPLPLPKLPQVPTFPIEILPNDFQDFVSDQAERARFAPDYLAIPLMCSIGSLLGRKLGIRLKAQDDWTEYGNVWGVIVGSPSSMKSPAMREALRPFKQIQVAADEEFRGLLAEHNKAIEIGKIKRDAAKKRAIKNLNEDEHAQVDLGPELQDAPTPRTLWTSDVTAEKLGELLAQNPNGILVERDELSSLLSSLDAEESANARGLYLSGWSGKEGYRFDRITRGTVVLPKFAISVLGGIQPGPLMRHVRAATKGERADGLLQRFQLAVWPDSVSFEYRDRYPNKKAKEQVKAVFERVEKLNAEAIGAHDNFGNDPPFIRLSDPAQRLFADWYERFMAEQRHKEQNGLEAPALSAHFGKYPGLLGKLALILHVCDEPDTTTVSESTLTKALAWLDFLAAHAQRVYHAASQPETHVAELMIARIRRDELPSEFKAWELSRKCWHGLTDREAVKRACRLLFEHRWLIEIDPGGSSGGRPADPVYAVSPMARAFL
jgi:putative DNA primase/helicase